MSESSAEDFVTFSEVQNAARVLRTARLEEELLVQELVNLPTHSYAGKEVALKLKNARLKCWRLRHEWYDVAVRYAAPAAGADST